MRSVNEIESVIGEGPFVLRHVRDVSRGHERGVCALCGRGLGMTFVFWAGPKGERQIELGAECSKTLPGSISRKIKETKSEIAAAKKATMITEKWRPVNGPVVKAFIRCVPYHRRPVRRTAPCWYLRRPRRRAA